MKKTNRYATYETANAAMDSPLTKEQLLEMHGKPVYVDGIDEWAIVDVEQEGIVERIYAQGANWKRNIITDGLQCYAREP